VIRNVIRLLLAVSFLAGLVWASDKVTLEGERTVYAVDCNGGAWDGLRCTGKLGIGPQYRFKASHSRNEVLFWVVGSSDPSGRYTDCQVKDRGNWTCNMQVNQKPSITYEMIDGRPTPGGSGMTMPYHAVAKWKWYLLRLGLPGFTSADY
jgi:hypothetical protein